MLDRNTRVAAAIGALLTYALPANQAQAQSITPPSHDLRLHYDSHAVANTGTTTQVVSSTTIHVQGASWLRLYFQKVYLAGDVEAGTNAILRITSFKDGATQELDEGDVRRWRSSSAYFNGDSVELEIVSPPGVGASRVVLRSVTAGASSMVQFSQCGATDDRVPSSDPRCGRLMPVACTGWIFDDATHSLLTAGHCAGSDPTTNLTAIEFNVPPSDASGNIQHPPPEDQYPIDSTSFQWTNGGVGNDYCYFGCFPNSNTALTPYQRQGASYHLALTAPPFNPAYTMRVTGYGVDMNVNVENEVQQTSTGPYFSMSGSTIRYAVDTEGGSSGSPVTWEDGGGDAIGIHTHSGCNTTQPINANWGTGSNNAGLKAAIANPVGVCAPSAGVSTYCTAKVNSQGCAPVIASTGAPTLSGGAGSFAITASQILNQKQGLLFYGFLPKASAFQGGFKCIQAPVERTPLQSSGGSASGDDCTGTFSYDMGARIGAGNDTRLVLGAIVYAQYWSRDPADPATTNLTAGLRFTIGP
jgi:hypothetical protein